MLISIEKIAGSKKKVSIECGLSVYRLAVKKDYAENFEQFRTGDYGIAFHLTQEEMENSIGKGCVGTGKLSIQFSSGEYGENQEKIERLATVYPNAMRVDFDEFWLGEYVIVVDNVGQALDGFVGRGYMQICLEIEGGRK